MEKTTPDILRMGRKKEYLINGIIHEDNMKLEPRILKKKEQDYRETLLRSSNNDGKNTSKITEILR